MRRQVKGLSGTLRVLVPAHKDGLGLHSSRLFGRHVVVFTKGSLVFYAIGLLRNIFGRRIELEVVAVSRVVELSVFTAVTLLSTYTKAFKFVIILFFTYSKISVRRIERK